MAYFNRLKAKLYYWTHSDQETAQQLNYLTLNIKEPQIGKDLIDYTIEQKIRIYWGIFTVSIFNLLFSLAAFRQGQSLFYNLNALLMIFWLVMVFGICRSRGKSLIRWLPSLYFFSISINVIICALDVSPTYS